MTEATTISAEIRERAGKETARAVRRAGFIPGVIYGGNKDPVLISLEKGILDRYLNRIGFFTRQFEIDVGGDKHRVLARDVQYHPVSDAPLHVDFLRVTAETKIHVNIEVTFVNEELSPGLKRGGVLNIVRHDIEVMCSVANIPERLEVDLTGLDIGDSVHISQIDLREGVTPTIADRDFTIATIAAPTVIVEEVAVEAEEAEEAEVLPETEEAAAEGKAREEAAEKEKSES